MQTRVSSTQKKVACFVAGHSGGHILPALSRARELLQTKQADEILFFSTTASLDQKILSKFPWVHTVIPLSLEQNVTRPWWRIPLNIIRLATSFFSSLYHLIRQRPSVVVSMGGYISIPVCLAAWVLRIPIELFELNVEPGKALHFLTPFARTIWTVHRESSSYLPAHKCRQTVYPLRFTKQPLPSDQARALLGLSPDRITIFVIGGSQGSLFLNKLTKEFVDAYPHLHPVIQFIHQTGSNDATDWHAWYAQKNIPAITFAYYDQIQVCYQAADVVISRAGAGTIAEILFFKKPSLVIPLITTTTKHQLLNAQAAAREHPGLITVQSADTSHSLQNILSSMAVLIQQGRCP